MLQPFRFDHNGKTYDCAIGIGVAPSSDLWWWFSVSDGDQQRYAPFRAAEADTQKSVANRIAKYYETRLERRAAPVHTYWKGRPKSPESPGSPASPASPASPESSGK